MKADQLKNSIIQYALEGKLVLQDPNEESTNIIIDKIKEKKEKLIKNKVIKDKNVLLPISPEEEPFEKPNTWEWIRLNDIFSINPKNKMDDEAEAGFIPMKMIKEGFQNKHDFEIKSWKNIKKGYTHFQNGDIAIAKITPCFENKKSMILKDLPNNNGAGTTELFVLRPYTNDVNLQYLLYLFKSQGFINDGVKSFTGTAGQQRVSKTFLEEYIIALPPKEEQNRIVKKIEILFEKIDQYDFLEQKITTLNNSFPSNMEKSILQYAMQGNLTKQNLSDEPVRILIEKINREKEKLLKEKAIKKFNVSPISDSEIPFELPKSWEWVRMQEVLDVRDGTHDTPAYTQTGIPLITSKNLKNGKLDYSNIKYISEEDHKKISQRSKVDVNDILFAMIGSIGNPVLISEEQNFSIKNVALFKQYPNKVLDMRYIYYVLKYLEDDLKNKASGGVQSFVSLTYLRNTLIPIAPIQEQKRITHKIEDLLRQIEKLNIIKQ